MAEINKSIVISKESEDIIKSVKSKLGFTFKLWSDEELLKVRREIRKFYRKQQKGKCAYCQNPVTLSASGCHVEHIVAKSLHEEFMFTPKNLCVICPDCNEIKREQEVMENIESTLKNDSPKTYPRSSAAFITYHPHFDNYNDHILNIDGYYLDKSEKGANTIRMCVLNRKLREFGYDDSAIAIPGHLDFMIRIFYSGKIDEIKKLIGMN
ncbi:hypothetical protein YY29_004291 [Salmonella enterica subsp. enterica]|nr:hypothetical protein [Salmonella enterica subsp. enterica serovar Tanger]EBV4600404.1 hypothetical protein [Salmonella enterica subsp. enterica serovar Tanger]EDV9437136.1 hypothetical protein [Salmonella enterica subsp. enterica]